MSLSMLAAWIEFSKFLIPLPVCTESWLARLGQIKLIIKSPTVLKNRQTEIPDTPLRPTGKASSWLPYLSVLCVFTAL